MPFKSEAQRRKFRQLEAEGSLPKGTSKRWEQETPKGKALPERVTKRRGSTKLPGLGTRTRDVPR